jgi:phage-related minor tail protein
MADNIKGVSVKIGADTSDFIKGLKAVDREINQTQKTANQLQKGLKLEYNEKNFVQAQKQIQQALSTTEQKAKAIKEQMQFLEKGGNVDTDGYRKLET